jgi:hypothetical protein
MSSFITCTLHQIKKVEMGKTYSMREEYCIQVFGGEFRWKEAIGKIRT